MGYVRRLVMLYKKKADSIGQSAENTWESGGTELVDCILKDVRIGLGDKKDKIELRFINYSNYIYGSSVDDYGFNVGDRIKVFIWRDRTSVDDTTDLIIDGTVSDIKEEISIDSRAILVTCKNFIEVLFDGTIPYTSGGSPLNFMGHISAILSLLSNYNSSRSVIMDSSNPTTKQDGSAFPTFPFAVNYTNVNQLIEKLVDNEYTGDGRYIYYVSSDNNTFKLVIRPKGTTIAEDFKEGELNSNNRVPEKISFSKITDTIVNFIIFNVGSDLEGNPLEFPEWDAVSVAQNNLKGKYLTDTSNIFEQVYLDELKADTSKTLFNYESGGIGAVERNSTDPYPKSYDYTFQFNTRPGAMEDYSGSSVGSPATANSDNNFNAILRIEAEARGREIAKDIIARKKNARIKSSLVFPFFNDRSIGELITITSPSFNLTSKELRINEIIHRPGMTELSCEEDEHASVGVV